MSRSETLNILTARQCDLARPGDTLRDGGGLYLEVTRAGRKYWRFRYTRPNSSRMPLSKRQNRLSFGRYPNPVSLAAARAQREQCRIQVANGIDPSRKRRDDAVKAADATRHSLRDIAETWFEKQAWSAEHLSEWKRTMKRNVFDQVVERRLLGEWPISEIKVRHVMEVLQRMEDQGLVESLHRCRQKLVHIFNRAIVLELRQDNPVLPLTKEFKPRRRNVPGLIALPWRSVGQFQLDIDASDVLPLTKLAMKFMLLTVQRSSEMRGATWDEVDRDRALWTIQASRMKGNKHAREDQHVPLSTQALDVLEQIGQLELA